MYRVIYAVYVAQNGTNLSNLGWKPLLEPKPNPDSLERKEWLKKNGAAMDAGLQAADH